MSARRYTKRRDECEKAIVNALRSAGAVVERLDGAGMPDLLVGFRGMTFLIECKDPDTGTRNSRAGGRRISNSLGLRDTQYEWWNRWRGGPLFIVKTPREALMVIGGNMPSAPLVS